MATTKRRYSKDELAQRGDAIYEREIRDRFATSADGKFVAIDVDSGEFEVDEDELVACDRLRARVPDAQIWLVKVGSRYAHRFGGRGGRGEA
jgi:hypothetical protein